MERQAYHIHQLANPCSIPGGELQISRGPAIQNDGPSFFEPLQVKRIFV